MKLQTCDRIYWVSLCLCFITESRNCSCFIALLKVQKFKQIVFFPFYDPIIYQAKALPRLLHYFSMHENLFAALLLIENRNFLGGCTSVIITSPVWWAQLQNSNTPISYQWHESNSNTVFVFSLMKQKQENNFKNPNLSTLDDIENHFHSFHAFQFHL